MRGGDVPPRSGQDSWAIAGRCPDRYGASRRRARPLGTPHRARRAQYQGRFSSRWPPPTAAIATAAPGGVVAIESADDYSILMAGPVRKVAEGTITEEMVGASLPAGG